MRFFLCGTAMPRADPRREMLSRGMTWAVADSPKCECTVAVLSHAFLLLAQSVLARLRSYWVVLGSVLVTVTAGVTVVSAAPPAEAASAPRTIVPSPNASTQTNQLSGVSCGARADWLAVGSYDDGSYYNGNVSRTLVEGSIDQRHPNRGRS
jgi:hypothetical protein